MTLIAIVIALLLERGLSYSPQWRAHDLTGRWIDWLDGRLSLGTWSLALYVLVPVAVIGGLHELLMHEGGVLLALPLSLAVLLACMGPRDLREQIHAHEQALHQGDSLRAETILRELIFGPRRVEGNSQGRSAVAACFVQGHERWFAPLVWFFLLGPAGAVAYRVLAATASHLRHKGSADEALRLAEDLHGALAWPSARIAALLYALAGSADHAFAAWRACLAESAEGWTRNSWGLLARTGLAAMSHQPTAPPSLDDLEAALRLLGRSLRLFLAVLALFTVGGWID